MIDSRCDEIHGSLLTPHKITIMYCERYTCPRSADSSSGYGTWIPLLLSPSTGFNGAEAWSASAW
jgi:hypothetical protein